jgi:large subunit ribosomal protein L23
MSKTIGLRPRLSEKTYGQSKAQRVYVVEVAKEVNKHTVARAIEAQFEVKVSKVNITNIPGKAKRTISITGKRTMNAEGRRTGIKKAYVTLAEGFALPFFDAIDEADAKETETQEKVDKAVAKKAAKEAKPVRRGIRRGKADESKDKESKEGQK